MHSTSSFCYTVLERVRVYLDDADVDAKYDNTFILDHCICPSMIDVLSRINNTTDVAVVNRFSVTITDTDARYKLPPCVQEVVRLVVVDDNDIVIYDAYPRDRMNAAGAGWALEGNSGGLELLAGMPSGMSLTFELWYISNGDFFPHYATDGVLDADKDQVRLSVSPAIGRVDRRVNAYAGGVLRLLPTAPSPIEERLISASSWDGADWFVDVNLPFTSATAGTVKYEIAPAGSQSMYEAIACATAMKLGVPRKITDSHMERLRIEYKKAMKTIGDNLTNLRSRVPKHFVRDTVDNPLARQWGFFGR